MARPLNRQNMILNQFQETQGLAADIIDGALADIDAIKLPILRELVSLLALSMNYLETITHLQMRNPDKKYFVHRRRKEIIRLWDGLLSLTKTFTAEVRKKPLEAKATTLATLANVSRRSFGMLAVLMEAEAQQKADRERSKRSGMSADEAAMVKEWDALGLEVDENDLTTFNLGDDVLMAAGKNPNR
jgi:hypothetical protein